jgi:hypothetical protein
VFVRGLLERDSYDTGIPYLVEFTGKSLPLHLTVLFYGVTWLEFTIAFPNAVRTLPHCSDSTGIGYTALKIQFTLIPPPYRKLLHEVNLQLFG